MLIENLEREYLVIRRHKSEYGIDQFVCSLQGDKTGEKYCITRISLEKLAEEMYTSVLIEFLTVLKNNREFYDFVEYFTDARFIYIVMILPTDISLEEKLNTEDCTFSERLEIGKCLIERMILLKAPHFFYWSALTIENIKISRAMDIGFQYDLTEICNNLNCNISEVSKRLAEQFQTLFEDELKLAAFPQMEQFITLLKNGKYKNYISIYEQYLRIYEKQGEGIEKNLTPNTFTFRLWEVMKKLGGKMTKLAAVLILLLAAVYTFLSIKEFVKPPTEAHNYQRIGSLEIKK